MRIDTGIITKIEIIVNLILVKLIDTEVGFLTTIFSVKM